MNALRFAPVIASAADPVTISGTLRCAATGMIAMVWIEAPSPNNMLAPEAISLFAFCTEICGLVSVSSHMTRMGLLSTLPFSSIASSAPLRMAVPSDA